MLCKVQIDTCMLHTISKLKIFKMFCDREARSYSVKIGMPDSVT